MIVRKPYSKTRTKPLDRQFCKIHFLNGRMLITYFKKDNFGVSGGDSIGIPRPI